MGAKPPQKPKVQAILQERLFFVAYNKGICQYQLSSSGWHTLIRDPAACDADLFYRPDVIVIRVQRGVFRIPSDGEGNGIRTSSSFIPSISRVKCSKHANKCTGSDYATLLSTICGGVVYTPLLSMDESEVTHRIMQGDRTIQTWSSESEMGSPLFITAIAPGRWLYLRTDRRKGNTQIHVVRASPEHVRRK